MKTSPQTSPIDRPFVVLGATGKTGRRVADRLEQRGHRVVRASRSGTYAFDWTDVTTWDRLLEGAYGVYAAYTPDLAAPGGIEVARKLGACVKKHGAERAVLLSGRGEEAAHAAEDAFFAELPLADTVRCAWFNQNFTEGLMAGIVATGEVSLPGPAGVREPFIDTDDIADCAVHCLLSPQRLGGVHELTGPEAIPLEETAAVLSRASGMRVVYRESSVEAFAKLVEKLGVPANDAHALAIALHEVLDGRSAHTTTGVSDLLGRPARSFERFARDAYAQGLLGMSS